MWVIGDFNSTLESKRCKKWAACYQDLITNVINGEKLAYITTYELEFVPEKEGEEQ